MTFSRWPSLQWCDAYLLEVGLALVVHFYYKTAEPDATHFFLHISLLLGAPMTIAMLLADTFAGSFASAFFATITIFHVTLIASIVIYRLSPWHPLARFSGPLVARISMFWTAYTIRSGKSHVYRKELHDKYGQYVRTGPNEISVSDASLISKVMGTSGMPKGPAWQARKPLNSNLISLRNLAEHANRRKRWSRAFSSTSVKGYEPTLHKRASQLASVLQSAGMRSTSLDLHRWLSFFTADFMGDMAFGGGFELMRDGRDTEGMWTLLEAEVHFQSLMQSFTWLSPLIARFPLANKKAAQYRKYAVEKAMKRKHNGSLTKDLFYHLMDEEGIEKVKPSDADVIGEASLAIVAGADTTSSVLSGLFFYILTNKPIYSRLQKEIDSTFPVSDGEPFDSAKLSQLPYLDAVINETLRLQPAVPTFLQRGPEPGSGGKWLDDIFLPDRSAVCISPYVLHRDPNNFSRPETFWPDRWLLAKFGNSIPETGEALVHNTTAFIPFSWGPANCVGKALALLEIRIVVALLVQKFEMRLADGYDTSLWEKQLMDFFVFETGELPVVLTPRAH